MTKNADPAALAADEKSPNTELRNAVSQRLCHSGHRGLQGVQVKVEDDRVVLSGTVPSYYLKQMAQETVRQVCPTRRVHNHLAVSTTRSVR